VRGHRSKNGTAKVGSLRCTTYYRDQLHRLAYILYAADVLRIEPIFVMEMLKMLLLKLYSVRVTCAQKLKVSQLCIPQGTKEKINKKNFKNRSEPKYGKVQKSKPPNFNHKCIKY